MSSKHEEFLKVIFDGERFRGGRLPLDVLSEYSNIRQIILQVAKEIWRNRNPSRRRLPKGFEDYFQLTFVEVTDGSAETTVQREYRDLTPLFDDSAAFDIFDEARAVFLEGITLASKNGSIGGMPSDLGMRVANIGKKIFEKESISFGNPKAERDTYPVFDASTRQKISKNLGINYDRQIESFGILSGVDEARSEVSIRTEFGPLSLKVPADSVRSDFDGKLGSLVEFAAETTFSSDGLLRKVDKTISVDLIEEDEITPTLIDTISSFSNLSRGWMNGEGEKINSSAIRAAQDLVRFVASIFSNPNVYPSIDGGVRIECEEEELDLSIDITSSRKFYLHALNHETDADFDLTTRSIDGKLLSGLVEARERVGLA